MDLELIRIDVSDHVALVTMDAPPVNAQNAQFNVEMAYVMDTLSDRADVRSVVLTGAGKIFSAGADIKARGNMGDPGEKWQHNRRARENQYRLTGALFVQDGWMGKVGGAVY